MRTASICLVVLALAVVGCGPAGGSSPSPSASAVPSPSPSASALSSPSALPSPSASTCPPLAAPRVPSDRLVGATLERGASADRFILEFGPRRGSVEPSVTLSPVSPPFSMGGSGLPVEVAGSRFLQLRLDGMTIYDDLGRPTFTGAPDQKLEGGPIRQAVLVDDFEGVVAWIVGYDGPGCVTFRRESDGGERLVLEIAHG